MKLLLFISLIPINFGMTLFAWLFVNWWAALFANKEGWLPKWLTWFQTFDNSLDAGVDSGFFKRSSNVWWNRTRWLYRNSTDGFAYYVLGIPFIPSDWAVQRYEGEAGVFKAKSTRGYFNYRGSRWNFAVNLGCKAWNMYDESTGAWETSPWGPEWRIPYVCSVSFNWRRVFGKEK